MMINILIVVLIFILLCICLLFFYNNSIDFSSITCKVMKNLGNGFYEIEYETDNSKQLRIVKSLHNDISIPVGTIIKLQKFYTVYYI